MKLFPRVFSYVIIFLIIYSISSAAMVSMFSDTVIKEQVYDNLKIASDSKAHHVESLLHEYKVGVESLAAISELSNSVNISRDNDVRISDAYRQVNLSLSVFHAAINIRLIDLNGTTIVSTSRHPGESPVNISTLLSFAMNTTYMGPIHKALHHNISTMSIASPLRVEGTTLGFIIVSFGAEDELFQILTERSGMGETGETYVVNSDGFMVSPSRFVNDSVLNLEVDTDIITMWHEYIIEDSDSGIPHYEHNPDYDENKVMIYEGYRGVEVLGTHEHIESMNWLLIAELDTSEAFQPVDDMVLFIGITTLIIIITGGVIAFISVRNFTRPILEIHEGMREIEKGNYDHEVQAMSDDEIGELALSLNSMSFRVKVAKKALEEHNRELEAQVMERTRELSERMKGSERFRIATLNMLEDISETKMELENSEKMYSSVVNTSMDGIFIVQSNKVRFVNSSFMKIMEYDEGELIDKDLNDLFHGDIRGFIQDLYDPRGDGDIIPELFETLFLTRSGENVPVEVRTSKMTYEGKDAIINFIKDLRETIKLEVGIADALSQLQQSEKRREEFIDMAAHELRTPLTAIKTYTEMMEEGYMGTFDDEEKEHLEVLGKSIARLNDQITGMLDASKVIAGKLKSEKVLVNMKEITEEIVEQLDPLFHKKNQILKIDVGDINPILATPDLMRNVMMNLISNANKFTPASGHIDIRLFSIEEELHVEVQDDGIGISEENLPNVFERFFIGDRSLTGHQPQLGLGLSVVRVIVEQHNGRIWVESELGKGSTFHFVLPMMKEVTVEMKGGKQ